MSKKVGLFQPKPNSHSFRTIPKWRTRKRCLFHHSRFLSRWKFCPRRPLFPTLFENENDNSKSVSAIANACLSSIIPFESKENSNLKPNSTPSEPNALSNSHPPTKQKRKSLSSSSSSSSSSILGKRISTICFSEPPSKFSKPSIPNSFEKNRFQKEIENKIQTSKPTISEPTISKSETSETKISERRNFKTKISEPIISKSTISKSETSKSKISERRINKIKISEPKISKSETSQSKIFEPTISAPENLEPKLSKPKNSKTIFSEPDLKDFVSLYSNSNVVDSNFFVFLRFLYNVKAMKLFLRFSFELKKRMRKMNKKKALDIARRNEREIERKRKRKKGDEEEEKVEEEEERKGEEEEEEEEEVKEEEFKEVKEEERKGEEEEKEMGGEREKEEIGEREDKEIEKEMERKQHHEEGNEEKKEKEKEKEKEEEKEKEKGEEKDKNLNKEIENEKKDNEEQEEDSMKMNKKINNEIKDDIFENRIQKGNEYCIHACVDDDDNNNNNNSYNNNSNCNYYHKSCQHIIENEKDNQTEFITIHKTEEKEEKEKGEKENEIIQKNSNLNTSFLEPSVLLKKLSKSEKIKIFLSWKNFTEKKFHLTKKNLSIFDKDVWIDGSIINAFLELLKAKTSKPFENNLNNDSCVSKNFPHTFFFNTYFFSKLFLNNKFDYDGVKKWTKNVDLFSFDLILIPINHSQLHWSLVAVDVSKNLILYLDSSTNVNASIILRVIMMYLKMEEKNKKGKMEEELLSGRKWKMKILTEGVPKQNDGSSCGLFVCLFCEWLSHGFFPPFPRRFLQPFQSSNGNNSVQDVRFNLVSSLIQETNHVS